MHTFVVVKDSYEKYKDKIIFHNISYFRKVFFSCRISFKRNSFLLFSAEEYAGIHLVYGKIQCHDNGPYRYAVKFSSRRHHACKLFTVLQQAPKNNKHGKHKEEI